MTWWFGGAAEANSSLPNALNLENKAEGGSDGTTVTTGNSGGGSGAAFDNMHNGGAAAGTFTFENAPVLKGTLAYTTVKTSGLGYNYAAWTDTSIGYQKRLFFRSYFSFAAPSANSYFMNAYHLGAFMCGMVMTTAGAIQFIDSVGGIIATTSSSLYDDGTVYRIEFMIDGITGDWELRFFTGDSTTADETFSGSAADFKKEYITSVRVGTSHTNSSAHTWTFSFDNIKVSNVDWIGPTLASAGPIVITHKAGIADTNAGAGLTATTTPTWTPAANALLIVYIEASTEDVSPTSVTGHGVTYTQMGRVQMGAAASTAILEMWAAFAGASPTSAAVVATWAAARSGYNLAEEEVTGYDDTKTLTVGGSGVFPQLVTATSGATATDTSGSITLAAASDSGNRTLAGFIHQDNVAITHEAGLTELYDALYTTPARSMMVEWLDTAFETTPSASWSPAERWAGLAVEIAVAQAPPATGQKFMPVIVAA